MVSDAFNGSSRRYTVEKISPMVMLFDMAVLLRPDAAQGWGRFTPVHAAKDLLESFKKQGHNLSVLSRHQAPAVEEALKDSRFLDFFEDRVYADKNLSDSTVYAPVLADLQAGKRGNILITGDSGAVRAGKAAGLLCIAFADSALNGAKTDSKRQELSRAGAVLLAETLIDIDTLLAARTLPSRMVDNWADLDDLDGFDGPSFG